MFDYKRVSQKNSRSQLAAEGAQLRLRYLDASVAKWRRVALTRNTVSCGPRDVGGQLSAYCSVVTCPDGKTGPQGQDAAALQNIVSIWSPPQPERLLLCHPLQWLLLYSPSSQLK